ncbi:YidC/Oxa1 family membrane protein insertase [Neptunomonas qingdaonensis]|uniref:Membrane protein insertase, YidC/Oxa1 family, C-terminal domain-containing protein n=1 Tax=Neptunomonas qingdaonensis TaxID=1045558 RepID=A0A1I2UN71_9GAMM|nr:YidC/Oxa1 family membrane protein insertase [Neptunomonas qingdaonensis]SFG78493.1 membrane protein insertase, YidC/Oxa1 family, C-terminal domain-containing protein [Neptunomonas qingdaonensis]
MVLDILYAIFILPIEWSMGLVFAKSYDLVHSYGLAILVLSLIVNIALIPVYYMSDKWQAEDRCAQERMAKKLKEIKLAFKGQERFMMTRMLYSLNHYHPLMAVRSSVGLLIQVPFFFAAYQLISQYGALSNVSFFIFEDLSKPDGLLSIGEWHINLMPFVMTAINLVSAYVYASSLTKKDKIQVYVIAGLFLVVLYSMPVALVLYWTMNNVFSLVKNIIYKNLVKINKVYNNNTIKFFKHIFFDLLLIFLGYFIITHVLERYLPAGVTKDFFSTSKEYYKIIPTLFIVFVFFKLAMIRKFKYVKERESLNYLDFTFVFLLYLPLAQYLIANSKDLLMIYFIQSLVFAFFALVLALVYLPFKLSVLIDKRILQAALFFSLAVIFYMPMFSNYFSFHNEANLTRLFPFFVAGFFLTYLLTKVNNKYIFSFSVVIFLTNSMSGFIVDSDNDNTSMDAEGESIKTLVSKERIKALGMDFQKKNSIYLLTYDSYVINETMLQYGIDNSHQEKYLKGMGFTIYPNTYSIEAASITTMGSVLDIKYETSFSDLKESTRGNAFVLDVLHYNNYKTAGYFNNDYFFRGSEKEINYKVTYPNIKISETKGVSALPYVIQSIKEGQFRFDVGAEYDQITHDQFLSAKYKFLDSAPEQPRFIYTHTGPSHSQNSGKCLPDETERFKRRLSIANIEMKKDIETIRTRDKNAIIIINGDHGPYLTKNCTMLKGYAPEEISRLDIQDRFGTFLAIKLPNNEVIDKEKISVLQDIFPEIFNLLTGTKIYSPLKVKPVTTLRLSTTAGVYVDDGIIRGGVNDGEPLFLGESN